MRGLRLIPDNTKIDFAGRRFIAFALTAVLFIITIGALATRGLNLGIDFTGGYLIEVGSAQAFDVGEVRAKMNGLGFGEVEVQEFGAANTLLIRIQPPDPPVDQEIIVGAAKNALGSGMDYRRVEFVGPRVGEEFFRDGMLASGLAVLMIGLYVAFRFEWQFGVSALIATFHDVFVTVGLFSVLQLDFNLTAIACLLTLAGYSINDTVVIFDRIRENLRRYKRADFKTIINMSVNQTLARTVMTSGTTALAILPLLLYGGSVLENFTVGMLFGILLGTFSSVYVAASLLLYMRPLAPSAAADDSEAETKVAKSPAA
jgi:preprotein translocase SecF subunit